MRIVHIVHRFYAGGGERILRDILSHSDRDRVHHAVLSLSDENERIRTIEQTLHIPYRCIDLQQGRHALLDALAPQYYERLKILRTRLHEALSQCRGITLASPPPASPLASTLLTVQLQDRSKAQETLRKMHQRPMVFKTLDTPEPAIRVSAHVYNSETDCTRFAQMLGACLST